MNQLIDNLLNSKIAAVRYRTLTEIQGLSSTDSMVIKSLEDVLSSDEYTRIMSKMHKEGYWLQKNPRTKETVGEGVEYGSFASTHFALANLSELGLKRSHGHIEKAANRYLNLIADDGDWWNHMSCLYGYNIRTFIRLGYRGDPRLLKAISLMLKSIRFDNGYLCDMHEKKGKKKSCYRGALKVLLAFSELPELWEEQTCKDIVSYFLNRKVIFNSKLSRYVNKDIERNAFPISWRANTYEALLALSKMGFGTHEALSDAWELLDRRITANQKYILDSTSAQSLLKAGAKGAENDWISFYVALAKKYRDA